MEFIKPNYYKIQKKKTGSGSEADQALSLTTNLRRDSRVVSLHNWRYFLAFFRWAEASAKRAWSTLHARRGKARVWRSSLAWRLPEKRAKITSVLQGCEWWTEQFQSFFFHIQIRLHFKTQHRQNNSIARHQQTLFFTFPIFTCSCSGASSRGHVTHTPLWAAYENLSGESPAPVTDTRGRGRGAVYLSFKSISNSNFSSKQGGEVTPLFSTPPANMT